MAEKQNYKGRKPSRTSKKAPLLFTVKSENELLKFLYQNYGRKKIKNQLKHRLVKVNGEVITQYNYLLKPGDIVKISFETSAYEKRFRGLSIVFEDDDIIVIDKHAGLLSVSTAKENKNTAFRILSSHVKMEDPDNKIFVVHRLDRDTSGLMIFAKNEKIKRVLQDNWKDILLERLYIALVEGKPEPWSGSITSYLREEPKSLKVYSSDKASKGEKAITHYKILKGRKNFTLLKVWLETGKKNQIRVHLADNGMPVVGDKKYGSEISDLGRLGLHAWVLKFKHPVSEKIMEFKTDIPRKFSRLV